MGELVLRLSCLTVILICANGCNVQVDKSHDGDADHVKIATPFGGISVNKNATSLAELGLPAYPGAELNSDKEGGKSARVDLGFGSWKLRVKVANYTTPDSREQVVNFYRKALSQYGTVIECSGNKTIGEPASTGEGLRCDSDDHSSIHEGHDRGDLQLKAGSPHHQHIVALDKNDKNDKDDEATTHFSLIALDLPHGFNEEQHGTN